MSRFEGGIREPGRPQPRLAPATVFIIAAISTAALAGCPSPQTAPSGASSQRQSQQAALRREARADVLLKSAVRQLNDLPAGVDTALRPPTIVLDSSKSSDSQDVLAVLLPNPNAPDGRVNVVTVPLKNSRFVASGVRSGDILKFYIKEDETVDEESRRSGFARRTAMEFTIAQVLDDQNLLLEGGLGGDIEIDVLLVEAVPQLGEPGAIVKVRAGTAYDQLFPKNLATPVPERIEVWRYVDDRLAEIYGQLRLYRDRRLPPLGWEPSPDTKTLAQIVVGLNQWLRQSNPNIEWRVEPLLQSLSPDLVADAQLAPHLSREALGATVFEPHESRLLQEAVWHRDIARWARGESYNNVDRAAALFDWTVRNVQLEDQPAPPHRPWKVLAFGRGTAEQRAWVFARLCRQLGLDVVLLAIPPEAASNPADSAAVAQSPSEAFQFWLPALVDNGQLYLFDTRLGLPVPGPNGDGVATLQQVQADDALLRQLDLPDAPYPARADRVQRVAAWIVADPFELTKRARLVDGQLNGDDRIVLSMDATAVADQLKSVSQVAKVQLWELPFRTLRDQLTLENTSRNPARLREVFAFEPFAVRPMLWKARTRHFQGRREIVDNENAKGADEAIDDHREAAQLYTDKSVRPTDRAIAQSVSGERHVNSSAKLDATYWVGLLLFADGKYDVAAPWLERPELRAGDSRWKFGATYNLARTYEAQGKIEEAIALLEADTSAQRHGNLLRARRLKSQPVKTSE